MGNSGEDSTKGIDVSVGGLVWVRRRNGSWWPGRVLGPDELPEGCMPTPRSGTPVKLLGREDASVDWYNLEKSKRVKAFRCGEYDACIEKAKASASNSSKKAVKYARREDAILHALEIESAHLGKDGPVLSTEQNVKNEEHLHHVGESPSSSHHDKETEDINEDLGMPEDDSDSGPDISHSGVSFEEPKRRRTPNDSDDGNEGAKRMRGLEDLGMGVSSSSRRKRSQIPHVHEFLKRKNRKRPLAKVLEYTAMVPVPLFCDLLSSPTGSSIPESKISGLQSSESKINDSVMVNNNSDSNGVSCENEISSVVGITENGSAGMLFDVPLVAEEKQSAGLSAIDAATQSDHIKPISLGNDEHNETGSTSSDTVDIHNITQRNDKGTAEWQLKGKRNSRSRKRDVEDEAETYTQGIERDSNRSGALLISRPMPDTQPEYFRGWSWNAPNKETVAPQRRLPYRQSRFVLNPKYDSSDFSLGHHTASSGLYDIDVEVKASYRPQGVPYISLMSKLHGQPIIGHPLSIEVLDNGFSDNILSFSECYSSSSEFDYNLSGVSVFRGDYEMKPRGHPPNKHRSKARRNGGLSKKIRKLSSLTGAHRRGEEQMKPVMEKLKGPSIACVPLNVVFSRINAALNSSIRPPPRLNTIGDV